LVVVVDKVLDDGVIPREGPPILNCVVLLFKARVRHLRLTVHKNRGQFTLTTFVSNLYFWDTSLQIVGASLGLRNRF